jgi:sensor histidine kinase YesM
MYLTKSDIESPLPDTVEEAWDEILYLRKDSLKMRQLAADVTVLREKEKRAYKANTAALGAQIKALQDRMKQLEAQVLAYELNNANFKPEE